MTPENKQIATGCAVIILVALFFMAVGGVITYFWLR